jgi:hypothetical protein
MRAREFTINVPITIKINGDGDPEVDMPGQEEPELQQNPVMVPPLQQHLELDKAEQGKESPVIDKITADDTIGQEPASEDDADQQLLQRLKQLISR